MQPAARIAATIEIMEEILRHLPPNAEESLAPARTTKGLPADKIMERYFKARRYMGSKDRGATAELVYWILRHKSVLEWWQERHRIKSSARLLTITALHFRDENPALFFTGDAYAPARFNDEEKTYIHAIQNQPLQHTDMPPWVTHNYPSWLHAELEHIFGAQLAEEMDAMNRQASVDLRANPLKTTREELISALAKEGVNAQAIAQTTHGIRLHERAPVFSSPLFKAGHFEVQDAASQAVAEMVEAKAGQKVIDFCAGAGGKTLAIAGAMRNKGRILALDTSASRLAQMKQRLKRAGVDNVQMHRIDSEHDHFLKRHKQSADWVLVDAPCGGSGTWRRNPDLKWRFNLADIEELILLQRKILSSAARLVKPGGKLVYSTCSLLERENEKQVDFFISEYAHFRVVMPPKMWDKNSPTGRGENSPFLWLTPRKDGTDGFFAAVLERIAE